MPPSGEGLAQSENRIEGAIRAHSGNSVPPEKACHLCAEVGVRLARMPVARQRHVCCPDLRSPWVQVGGTGALKERPFAQSAAHFSNLVLAGGIADAVLQSIELLANATNNFARRCIDGLTATDRGPELVEKGLALVTSLVPAIGYDAAAEISKEAFQTGRTIREIARERTTRSDQELEDILDPASMTANF